MTNALREGKLGGYDSAFNITATAFAVGKADPLRQSAARGVELNERQAVKPGYQSHIFFNSVHIDGNH